MFHGLTRFQKYGTDKSEYEPLVFKYDFSGTNELLAYGTLNGVQNIYEETIAEGIGMCGAVIVQLTRI